MRPLYRRKTISPQRHLRKGPRPAKVEMQADRRKRLQPRSNLRSSGMDGLVIIIGLLEAALVAGGFFVLAKKMSGGGREQVEALEEEVRIKREMCERIDSIKEQSIDFGELKTKVQELLIAKESLKAERGRVTITQAELETIEIRLRELDEIARELEASALETKEELKILQKKEKDLNQKNDVLKAQIADSVSKMDDIFSKIEMNAQMQERVDKMKQEMIKTESQITTLLIQIQQGNEQYFVLKKRYDALDIEYAQLFEKFSEQQAQQ